MEIDTHEPLRIHDDEGYYQLEKVISPSGEKIVRAAYYTAADELDPVKTAEAPNRVLVEQFRLTVMNDLIDDKDALAHVMEEIFQYIIRKTFGPPRKKRKASRH